ncbi:hypothetical protein PM082_010715 [Marasmius tenuissimus]|nr:hypothetical protein PM082_010715 [Marasmius tenuissimus]
MVVDVTIVSWTCVGYVWRGLIVKVIMCTSIWQSNTVLLYVDCNGCNVMQITP